jgi:hypothetical protein
MQAVAPFSIAHASASLAEAKSRLIKESAVVNVFQ